MSNNQIVDSLENSYLPKLRFSDSKNNKRWKKLYLDSISKNLDNLRVPISSLNRENGEIPYYGASGIVDYVNDFIFDDDLLCISEDGANLLARVYPIAFSVSGKSWINNHAHVLKFNKKEHQIIVEAYLNSISLEDYLTGMAQPKLNKAMLNKIPLYLPVDTTEQIKLASFITSLNTLLEHELDKLNRLNEHKNSLLQQLFPKKGESIPRLRFSDFSENWEEISSEKAFSRIKTKNSVDEKNVLTISAQKGLISQEEYFNKSVSSKNVSGYYLIKKGEFAYNKSYSAGYPMGAIKKLSRYKQGVVSPLYICFSVDDKIIDSEFFQYYCDGGFLNSELGKIAQEGARNHGLLNIGLDDFFKNIIFKIPKKNEQEKIASCLTSLDEVITNQNNYIKYLKEHKKGLMQQLFPVLEDFSA
ncbi:restriction endonuclease subunit S [Acinetobacter haemolyticus]|uniref:restriction endonuclease subunit S n=1 Tax=Acinetobacter haemolyticus TaxID=29430 RepID=UPI002DB8428A|nr:restriction endonuclease subunit S [Acinetobacter haemolyticus]MEB6675441.1 restriction endonuclease subunit S [Acinetobacter haemolyticus]